MLTRAEEKGSDIWAAEKCPNFYVNTLGSQSG